MKPNFRRTLEVFLLLALIGVTPMAVRGQSGCQEIMDLSTVDSRNYGIGVHRSCGDIDPICEVLRLKQIALGVPVEVWIRLSREAAYSAGVSPMPPNIRNQVGHLFPAPILDKVRFKAGSGFLGSLQWFREEMGGGAITLNDVIVFADESSVSNVKLWVHELEHVRQYDQLGMNGFAQAYVDQTCILPGDIGGAGYDSGNCQLERIAVRKSNLWDRSDLAAYCTFFWRYVDGAYTGANGASDGTSLRPYPDLPTGVNATATGSILWVQPGTYAADGNRLAKKMTILAPRGGVNIRTRSTTVAGPTLASVSAASYIGEVAADSIAAAFGANLAAGVAIAATLPLPTTLGGVTVKVTDAVGTTRDAPLFFVSPNQINYQIPTGVSVGIASIAVYNSGGTIVASGTTPIIPAAPSLFSANASGEGVPAALLLRVRGDGLFYEPVARYDGQRFVPVQIDLGPESDQVFLVLYGTGFRSAGAANAMTTIGDAEAEVLYAGAAPGFAGLDQANVRIPRSLIGKGEVSIAFTADNRSANAVTINIR